MRSSLPTPKQAQFLWLALNALAVVVVIGALVALVWGAGRILDLLSPVLWPLAIAGVVACVLSPVVDFFERRKLSRLRSVILVFAIAAAIFGGILASIIPQLVVETRELVSKIPEYSQRIQQRADQFIAHPPELLRHLWPAQFSTEAKTPLPVAETSTNQIPPSTNSVGTTNNITNAINALTGASTNSSSANATNAPVAAQSASDTNASAPLASVTDWLKSNLAGMGKWLLGQVGKIISGFSLLAGLILIPVYAFYFLLEQRAIEDRWRDYLPLRDSRAKEETIFVLNAIGQYLVAFFRGQVLVAICDSVLLTIGFLCIGLNYAYLLGCAAVLLTMIPFLGAITICLTGLLLAFVQYGDWFHPLLVLAIFAVVQLLEGFVITPKIMGDRVGLHPAVIIIAVMTGTTLLGGILGGILAIPLAAALRVIMFRYVWKDVKQ